MNQMKIFQQDLSEIKQNIKENKISVCVIGIGRIGLPTALSFAKSGFNTIGIDINEKLIQKIEKRDFPLKDEPGYTKIFQNVIDNEKFSATTKIEEIVPKSDVILLSLPTPMDQNNIPDYSIIRDVGKKLHDLVSPNSVIIMESTIEPGFIENEFSNIIQGDSSRLQIGKNLGLGVCPETANPGEIMKDFEKLPRLVGAMDNKTTEIITQVYQHVFPVELVKMPNCKTANAVKLTTNVFRDVNIAFINELAIFFERLGIDTNEVLAAANKKYNFQVHYPGAGVGGPCLPVNSYQFLNSSKKLDGDLLKLVKISREINENMPNHVVKLIEELLSESNKQIKSSNILIMGVSYKPNVKDIQLSPAEIIIERLKEMGIKVRIYDPYFIETEIYEIKTESNLQESLKNSDLVVIVTAHDEFRKIDPKFFVDNMKVPRIIDTRGIIEKKIAKNSGLIFRGLGCGK